MKNWLPLVSGPALAMATDPSGYCGAALAGSSSANLYPGPPVPVPVGSPVWSTKPGMTRWKTTQSKKCWRARKTKLLTASGAAFGARTMVKDPTSVVTVAV